MSQIPKGTRKQLSPRLPLEIYQLIKDQSAAEGMSMSQYAADLLAIKLGRPDLVWELGKTSDKELPYAM